MLQNSCRHDENRLQLITPNKDLKLDQTRIKTRPERSNCWRLYRFLFNIHAAKQQALRELASLVSYTAAITNGERFFVLPFGRTTVEVSRVNILL